MPLRAFLCVLAFALCMPVHASETPVCKEFTRSDAVLVVTALEEKEAAGEEGEQSVRLHKVRTLRDYHGGMPFEFEILSPPEDSALQLSWGEHYLLFLERREEGWVIRPNGNSAPLSDASEATEKISYFVKAKGGTIRGRVSGKGKADLVFFARTGDGFYSGVTDDEGGFEIAVPEGTYAVEPAEGSDRLLIRPGTEQPPDAVEVRVGSCVDLLYATGTPETP